MESSAAMNAIGHLFLSAEGVITDDAIVFGRRNLASVRGYFNHRAMFFDWISSVTVRNRLLKFADFRKNFRRLHELGTNYTENSTHNNLKKDFLQVSNHYTEKKKRFDLPPL